MKTNKILSLLLVLVMATVIFTGCGESTDEGTTGETKDGVEAEAEEENKHLTVALQGEPQTLEPYSHSTKEGFIPSTLIFESLLKKNEITGEIEPALAESYELIDDTTIKFTLRQGVKFHDGSDFTADDVIFSLTRAAESSFTTNLFGVIDTTAFNKIDDYTLEVGLQNPNASIIEALASYRGSIISSEAFATVTEEEFGRKPVGTGPLKFVEWVSGDRLEFDKNEEYWGEDLAFDSCTARIIVEASSRAIVLETGEVDMAFELSSSDWSRLEENPETQLIKGVSYTTSFITLNSAIAPLDDIKVRQALAYGTNMDAVVKTAWDGTAATATSYYTPTLVGHTEVGPMTYDVEKSKELLAEAGYPDGLTVTFVTFEKAVYMSVAEILQNMWQEIGVTVDLQIVDLATFITMNNEGKIPVSCMTTTAAIADPTAALLIWPSERTISVRHGDTVVDDYMLAGSSTYDEAERAEIYGELQQYLWDNMYVIPAAYPESAYGASSRVNDFEFYENLSPDLTQITFK